MIYLPEVPMLNLDEDASFWTAKETEQFQEGRRFDPEAKVISTIEDLNWLIEYISKKSIVALDTETTSLDYHSAELVGIGLAVKQGTGFNVFYIPLSHKECVEDDQFLPYEYCENQLHIDIVIAKLKPFLENPNKKKLFHNAKFDIQVFKKNGINLKGLYHDTYVASYVLKHDHYSEYYKKPSYHKLDYLVLDYIPIFNKTFLELTQGYPDISFVSINEVAKYCGIDCYSCFVLYEKQSVAFSDPDNSMLENLFYNIEMPMVEALALMEYEGLCINEDWYYKTKEQLTIEAQKINERVWQYKPGLNINSYQQLNRYFFNELGLSTKGLKKGKDTKKGEQMFSLNKDTIASMAGKHPVIDTILEYRNKTKMIGTYIDGILDKVNSFTGKLHPEFSQCYVETGRLSCRTPNTQNFPGKMREGIIPREGYSFVAIDYEQCELKILAYMANEFSLADCFINGHDAHCVVASILFNEEIGKKDVRRKVAKILNFGIIYGMQANKLMVSLLNEGVECDLDKAQKLLNLHAKKFPSIAKWMNKIKKQVLALGYTETIMGRRRYFNFVSGYLQTLRGLPVYAVPDIDEYYKRKSHLKMHPEDAASFREAGNAPIQGSNADITKMAHIEVNKYIEDTGLTRVCRVALSIHDELVFEIKDNLVEYLTPILQDIMENVYKLGDIPLTTSAKAGKNWMEVK